MKALSTTAADEAIRLHLLGAIAANPRLTQRRAARDLDVALGIVNSQLKHLVETGLIRIEDKGGNRYSYFLTDAGTRERQRLGAAHLAAALDPFRAARDDVRDLLQTAARRGWTRIALVGQSALVDAVVLAAAETTVTLLGVIDKNAVAGQRMAGLPVGADARAFGAIHALVITDVAEPEALRQDAIRHFPAERVLVPGVLSALGGARKTA